MEQTKEAAKTQHPDGDALQQPQGAAAARVQPTTGTAASQPAGAAIAPAKQKRSRSFLIRLGVLAGAASLSAPWLRCRARSPSKPPGSQYIMCEGKVKMHGCGMLGDPVFKASSSGAHYFFGYRWLWKKHKHRGPHGVADERRTAVRDRHLLGQCGCLWPPDGRTSLTSCFAGKPASARRRNLCSAVTRTSIPGTQPWAVRVFRARRDPPEVGGEATAQFRSRRRYF